MKDNEVKLFEDIKDLNIDVNGPVSDAQIKDALNSEENLTDIELAEIIREANVDDLFNL